MIPRPALMVAADMLAAKSAGNAEGVRHIWQSDQTKNPRHLRFGADQSGQIGYMRDNIMMVSGHKAGSYTRVREFSGPMHDEHEVVIYWDGPIFDSRDGSRIS